MVAKFAWLAALYVAIAGCDHKSSNDDDGGSPPPEESCDVALGYTVENGACVVTNPPEIRGLTLTASTSTLSVHFESAGGSTEDFIIVQIPGTNPPADCQSGVTSPATDYTFSNLTAGDYAVRVCARRTKPAIRLSSGLTAKITIASPIVPDPPKTFDPKIALLPQSGLIYAQAVQADGKIVVVGKAEAHEDIIVCRTTVNGGSDPTFGSNGCYIHPATEGRDIGYSVGIQSTGKIIVAGSLTRDGIRDSDTIVLRLTATGSLDNTFGDHGHFTINAGRYEAPLGGLLVLANNNILISGYARDSRGTFQTVLMELEADGQNLRNGFGTFGSFRQQFGFNSAAVTMAVQEDGKILVGGWIELDTARPQNAALWRFSAAGVLDETFGQLGVQTYGEGMITGLAPLHDGKVLASASLHGTDITDKGLNIGALKINQDGALDPSFASGGVYSYDHKGDEDYANGLLVLGNGQILITGWVTIPDVRRGLIVLKLQANGSALDTSFADHGLWLPENAMEGRRLALINDHAYLFGSLATLYDWRIWDLGN